MKKGTLDQGTTHMMLLVVACIALIGGGLYVYTKLNQKPLPMSPVRTPSSGIIKSIFSSSSTNTNSDRTASWLSYTFTGGSPYIGAISFRYPNTWTIDYSIVGKGAAGGPGLAALKITSADKTNTIVYGTFTGDKQNCDSLAKVANPITHCVMFNDSPFYLDVPFERSSVSVYNDIVKTLGSSEATPSNSATE